MNKFYLVYSILMILSTALYAWQTFKYTHLFFRGMEKQQEFEADENTERLTRHAGLRMLGYFTITLIGFYLTIDCIQKAWYR